ncbi:hypothetical protein MPC1_10340003 [Methylocella tundrae]|nr:hypothetical protein MPC1_10340003 [Methylocella tundrae]
MARAVLTKIIHRRTPESAAMLANTKRAMAITARLNRLTFNDAEEIRAVFSELIGKKVDDSFLLIPPFYTADGDEIRVRAQCLRKSKLHFLWAWGPRHRG